VEENDVFKELQDVIGEEAAKRFVEHYSGSNLYTPQKILLEMKHEKIIEEFKKGASYKELARRYGFTERHIRRIVHKRRPKGPKNKT
jgi:Mor family transcriptional regulator